MPDLRFFDFMPELRFFYFMVVLWLIYYYLVIPLVIRFQQRLPAHPTLRNLDLNQIKHSLAEFMTTRTTTLFALGFDEPTLVQLPDSVPNVTTYLIMLVHRQTGDKAMVTVIVGHGPVPLQTLYVEFSTRFETSEVFNTHNSRTLCAFPPAPKAVRTQVPQVTDPRELYQLHQYVMHRHNVGSRKVLYEPGQALDWLIEYAFIRTYDTQVQRSWLAFDEEGDSYHYTFKGAYLVAWGLMQPFKALRYVALYWRARKTLAEFRRALQDGTWTAPPSERESIAWTRHGQREAPNTSITAPLAPETGIRWRRPQKFSD